MLNGLDLFSGIGGISIALEPWVRTAAYCENNRYAQAVLLSRMADSKLALAPIWDDVQTLSNAMLPRIDVITAGFPCQNISVAGRGEGLGGEQSRLAFEALRLVSELRPSFVFLENVPAIRARGAHQLCARLACLGYDSRFDVLSAEEMGAPHKRSRWFLLAADTNCVKLWDEQRRSGWPHWENEAEPELPSEDAWRNYRPEFCRMDDGLPPELDRLRGLGNAVVPIQAREAFSRLMGIK